MTRADLRFLRRYNQRLELQRASPRELGAPRPSDIRIVEAADFVTGGEADFARAADRRGIALASWLADRDETHAEFIARAKQGARALGAARLVVGGVPDLETMTRSRPIRPARPPVVAMPDGPLHTGQIDALHVVQTNRFTLLRAGRRFGKSALIAALAADTAMLGGMAGLFAPTFKLAVPLFDVLARALAPIIFSSHRAQEIRVVEDGGGAIEIWNLESGYTGRSRSYRLVALDEAAFCRPSLDTAWHAAIRPTLVDVLGAAVVASTPNGVSEDGFFWRICSVPEYGFREFVAPTLCNPIISPEEIETLRGQHNAAVFSQEFEAQFVNLAGVGLFDVSRLLDKGNPWEMPEKFDKVFATLDSGIRGGQEHDASAILFLGLNVFLQPQGLFVLDWEAVELGAGDLEYWFAIVGRRLDEYAEKTRFGSEGVFVERAGLGEMLLSKANALGVLAQEIKPELVARGKDLRALAAETYINSGRVKLTTPACERISKLKGVARNHLLAQTASFRIADREAYKRSDDLVDALVYAALVAFDVD
jgi:hypothetical protein